MHDLSIIAASEWARTNTRTGVDPVKFGNEVALAYLACRATGHHAGDEAATAAALAALSVRPEVLQAIALLSSLPPACSKEMAKTNQADSGVSV